MEIKLNHVQLSENLEFLKKLDANFIDLIYIDPPFYSGVDYKEFSDLWSSLEDYLDFMKFYRIECKIFRLLNFFNKKFIKFIKIY